ncbi:Dolichyl-phosphate-mannose-protein mannosyltransferase-domain-containing protein, partial [Dissophora ornata]
MERRDWAALGVLTVVTLTVRMWKIHSPGVIIMDEAHVGKNVNGYLTKQFTFDRHPPFGKLLLAAISSTVADYSGTFAFENTGDAYPHDLPYVHMRVAMALLGALCAPMAYMTLKAKGQSTNTATVATILIAFDNALTANNRLMVLEPLLMFFSALSFMSWIMFTNQSPRPFSAVWWMWLTTTGLAVSGALSTKASGIFAFMAIGFLAARDSWSLAANRSVNNVLLAKHCIPHIALLVALPVITYIYFFQFHFNLQTFQPSTTNYAQDDYDLNLLTYPFRNSLSPPYESEPELYPIWSDVVYGSVIQLQSEVRPPIYVHSFLQNWVKGSRQQQVTGYEYPDLNTHWIIGKAPTAEEKAANITVEEIPSRLRYVKHGETIKLRHVSTRKCLHSHNVRTMGQKMKKTHCEVSAYGAVGMDGDDNDWWVIEVVDTERMKDFPKDADIKVKALETTFRLRQLNNNCHLGVTDDDVPETLPGGPGRRELTCLKDAKVRQRTIWRI